MREPFHCADFLARSGITVVIHRLLVHRDLPFKRKMVIILIIHIIVLLNTLYRNRDLRLARYLRRSDFFVLNRSDLFLAFLGRIHHRFALNARLLTIKAMLQFLVHMFIQILGFKVPFFQFK